MWHFDQFFTLLYQSQYVHSLIIWALICLPGAALVYVAANTIRTMNFMDEEMKQQHKSMMAEVTSLREELGGPEKRLQRRVRLL